MGLAPPGSLIFSVFAAEGAARSGLFAGEIEECRMYDGGRSVSRLEFRRVRMGYFFDRVVCCGINAV